jgi:hypothetical protein
MKSTLFLIVICFSISVYAQNLPGKTDSEKRLDIFTDAKRHELSIDVLAGLTIPALQPRYEYILGRYSGVGVDVFLSLSDDDIDYDDVENFSITPFYRQYFFSKEDYGARGFYGEGFLKAYTYEKEIFNFVSGADPVFNVNEESYFETAIGVGIGWKWVSNSGFMIDVGLGIGRNLGLSNEPEETKVQVIPRGGVHFGWRF